MITAHPCMVSLCGAALRRHGVSDMCEGTCEMTNSFLPYFILRAAAEASSLLPVPCVSEMSVARREECEDSYSSSPRSSPVDLRRPRNYRTATVAPSAVPRSTCGDLEITRGRAATVKAAGRFEKPTQRRRMSYLADRRTGSDLPRPAGFLSC